MNENISGAPHILFKGSEQRTLCYPPASRLPADAVCRKNAQSSLRRKRSLVYGVPLQSATISVESEKNVLKNKNWQASGAGYTWKTLPPAAPLPNLARPPLSPLPHPKRHGHFHKKRHPGITMPFSPGQTAASPRIKRGKPSTPARPFPYGICGTPIFRAPFPIPESAAPPCRRAACPSGPDGIRRKSKAADAGSSPDRG